MFLLKGAREDGVLGKLDFWGSDPHPSGTPFEPAEQVADEAEVEEGFDFSSFSEEESEEEEEQGMHRIYFQTAIF